MLIYIHNKRLRWIFEGGAISFCNSLNIGSGFYNISSYLSQYILNNYNIFQLLLIYSTYIIILHFLFFFLLLIQNLSRDSSPT